VPIVLGVGSTETEKGRAFFQDRLRLFGGWIFLISSGFYVVGMALMASYDVEFNTATLFHLIGTVIAGGIWAAGRGNNAETPLLTGGLLVRIQPEEQIFQGPFWAEW